MWFQETLIVRTAGRGTYDLSEQVAGVVIRSAVQTGLCHIFVQHTSASLMLCENADPTVRRDLEAFLSRLIPRRRSGLPTYGGRTRRHAGACTHGAYPQQPHHPGGGGKLFAGCLAGHLSLGAPPGSPSTVRQRDGER